MSQPQLLIRPTWRRWWFTILRACIGLVVVLTAYFFIVQGADIAFMAAVGGLLAVGVFFFYLVRFRKRAPEFLQVDPEKLIVVSRHHEETVVPWRSVEKAVLVETFNGSWTFELAGGREVVVFEDGIRAADWEALSAVVRKTTSREGWVRRRKKVNGGAAQ
jgi:hypothetical protein